MGIAIHTFSNDQTPNKNHAADGEQWSSIPDEAFSIMAKHLNDNKDRFPQLRRIRPDGVVEFSGESDLQELILETEQIPGREDVFRNAMGKLHGAACQALFSQMTVRCSASG